MANKHAALRLILAGLAIRVKVNDLMKSAATHLVKKLDNQNAKKLEKLLVATLKCFKNDHTLLFICRALERANREMLSLMMDEEEGKVTLGTKKSQKVTNLIVVKAIVKTLRTGNPMVASVEKFALSQA